MQRFYRQQRQRTREQAAVVLQTNWRRCLAVRQVERIRATKETARKIREKHAALVIWRFYRTYRRDSMMLDNQVDDVEMTDESSRAAENRLAPASSGASPMDVERLRLFTSMLFSANIHEQKAAAEKLGELI